MFLKSIERDVFDVLVIAKFARSTPIWDLPDRICPLGDKNGVEIKTGSQLV